MKRKLARLFLFIFIMGLVSCGQKKEEVRPEKISTVTGVQVETVKSSPQEDFYEAVATVRSKTTSVISSKIVGNITAVHVREGDPVKPGQLLIEIDNREAAAQVEKAQAGVREAQEMLREAEGTARAFESALTAAEADQDLASSTFTRYQALYDRKSVSQQEFDEARAKYRAKTAEVERAKDMLHSIQARKEQALARIEQAKAGVSQARIMVDYGRVSSPLRGLVAAKQAEVGALASPVAPLLTIEDDTHYRLEASVEDAMVGRIRLGEPVQVNISALGDQKWGGRVGEIQPTADPASRSSVVKIDLPADLGKRGLRSGLFGRAWFPIGKKQVVTIPQKAILQRGQLLQVFAVDQDNRARLRLIKAGKAHGDRVEVLSGIEEGERIIVEGVERVKDGDRVES